MNNMQLNEDKFIYMNFNIRPTKFPLANLPFYSEAFHYQTSEGNYLEPSEKVKDLGIIFTPNLTWSAHVSATVKKAKQKSGWVLNVFKTRSPPSNEDLYKALVRSHLEYSCPVWNGLSM